jgi:hypothetical protein
MRTTLASTRHATHSSPWLLFRLVALLDGQTHLAEEVRLSVDADGVCDPERLAATLLGVAALAERAGWGPAEVRRLVRGFVASALAPSERVVPVEQVVREAGRLVDACYPEPDERPRLSA